MCIYICLRVEGESYIESLDPPKDLRWVSADLQSCSSGVITLPQEEYYLTLSEHNQDRSKRHTYRHYCGHAIQHYSNSVDVVSNIKQDWKSFVAQVPTEPFIE